MSIPAPAPAPVMCMYKFPIHPRDMFNKSPKHMDVETRMMRTQMIQLIAELSESHTQEALDNNVYVDIENKHIIGMDMSCLMNADVDFCIGDSKMKLKDVTAKMWTRMRL